MEEISTLNEINSIIDNAIGVYVTKGNIKYILKKEGKGEYLVLSIYPFLGIEEQFLITKEGEKSNNLLLFKSGITWKTVKLSILFNYIMLIFTGEKLPKKLDLYKMYLGLLAQ